MLITPETSDERIRFIDDNTDGFIYMVSSAATTGAQKHFGADRQAYFSNSQTLHAAWDNANGAIIGSKFVQLLDQTGGDADAALDKLFLAVHGTAAVDDLA